MGFYSIVALAKNPVSFANPFLLLDKGRNVFTVLTEDVEELSDKLKAEGVEFIQINRLDDHQPLDPQDTLLLLLNTEGGSHVGGLPSAETNED